MFPSIKPDKFEVKDVVLSKVLTDILKPLRASYIVEKDHVLNIPLK